MSGNFFIGVDSMQLTSINLSSFFVAAIIYFVLGFVWYSPVVFGKMWMHEHGMRMKENQPFCAKSPYCYIGSVVEALLCAFVLAQLVNWLCISTFAGGACLAFWVWLGFNLTTAISSTVWGKANIKMAVIHTVYRLIAFILMAGTLATMM